MMQFDKFKEIFLTLKSQQVVRDEFLDKLPISIRDAFFDNEYVESLVIENNILLKMLFGERLWDDINYFLFEDPSSWEIVSNGKVYSLHNDEEVLDYFKKEYDFE